MSAKTIHKSTVIEMLLAGAAPRDIIRATGCSEYTISKYRHQMNLPPFSKGGRPRKSA